MLNVFSYLFKMKHSVIHFGTNKPDYTDQPDFDYDWEASVYGKESEDVPLGIPHPLGSIKIYPKTTAALNAKSIQQKSLEFSFHLIWTVSENFT